MTEPAFVNGFVDGKDLLLLYRNDAGTLMARRKRAEWSSFYRRSDLLPRPDLLRDLRNSEFVVGVAEEGDWYRVKWAAGEWRRKAHGPGGFFAELGIPHFEADVDPIRRFLSDTGTKIAKPRRVYLDIETDSRVTPAVARQGKARVLCWTLVDDDVNVVAAGMLQQDTDEDEVRILEEFWRALDPYDQVVAWFGDIFDFPIIHLRSSNLGVQFKDPRRWLWMDFAPVYERMNKNAAETGDEKESLSLNAVCQVRIGEGKHDFDASKTYEEWAAGGERRQGVADYCCQDTKLLPKLARKTGFLDTNDAVCEVGRMFADTDSANPTNYVDGFLLRLGVERGGQHFPTRAPFGREEQERHEKFKGAFVMEPKCRAIERNLHVCDFAGMYPSIIMSFNMSPETKRVDVDPSGPIPEGVCRCPSTGVAFSTTSPGILPDALKTLREMRKFWQKKQAALPPGSPEWVNAGRLSTAYKVIMNSFYGVVGSPFSRFFDRAIAESVTQTGVWLIQQTIREGELRGMEALYTDTDSVFVRGVSRQVFEDFVKWCNVELYPAALKRCGCVENWIEIAYEKEFARLVMVSAKRYVATFAHYKGTASCSCTTPKGSPGAVDVHTMRCKDCGTVHQELPPPRGKPEIRGLEFKRGDTNKITRQLQWDVIQKLMRDLCDDPEAFVPIVERYRRKVLDEPLDIEEVKLSQALSKPLREYVPKKKKDGEDAAMPMHVRIAHVLKERGEQIMEGTRIPYYVIDGSTSPKRVAPAVDYKGDPDRFYLWEDKVWPPTMHLLAAAFPGYDWKKWKKARPPKVRAKGQVAVPWDTPKIEVNGQKLVRLRDARNPGSPAPDLFEAASDDA